MTTERVEATTLFMFRSPTQTKHFNKNQKLWVMRLSGAMAAQVRGKYRGRGRYVTAWITWGKKGDEAPNLIDVPVTQSFYNTIRAGAKSDEGYERIFSPSGRNQ